MHVVRRPRLKLTDVLLFLFAIVVAAGAVYVVKQGSTVPRADDTLTTGPAVTATPEAASPQPTNPTPTPTGTSVAQRRVVLLGEDLTEPAVVSAVAGSLGTSVTAAVSSSATPVPTEVYVDLLPGPGIVVIQLPESSTSRSDALAAVMEIRSRVPGTKVVLVGSVRVGQPGGAGLATLSNVVPVTYLDPIAEQWVDPPTSATLNDAQHQQVAAHLAHDLTPLLS